MAKGIQHTGDPEIRQGIFDNVPDGTYAVNGIAKFISTDENGVPCFKPNKRGELSVMFEFRPVTGAVGPAGSATPAEFWMLVEALGGDPSVATAKQRTSSDALLRAQTSVNSSTRSITVQSTTGWANGLRKQLNPPKGKYRVKLAKAHRPDFKQDTEGVYSLEWQTDKNKFNGKDQQQLVLEFEITGSGSGKSTLYDGFSIWQYMSNPFTSEYEDLEENVHRAVDEGRPLWGHTENGGILPAAGHWEIFTRYFAPEMLEYDWQTDPSKSDYGICEVEEPQVVIINAALKAQKSVIVYYKERERSKNGAMCFYWSDVPVENELPDIEVEEQPIQLTDLTGYIQSKWKDIQMFEQPVDEKVIFTEAGKGWAKEYLSAPWTSAGFSLENRKPLHELNAEEVTKLFNAFKKIYGEVDQKDGW